jgi:hypothetical protein
VTSIAQRVIYVAQKAASVAQKVISVEVYSSKDETRCSLGDIGRVMFVAQQLVAQRLTQQLIQYVG